MSKLKITSRMIGESEIHELFLPNGQRVASGSLAHCKKERDRWDEALAQELTPVQLELKFE